MIAKVGNIFYNNAMSGFYIGSVKINSNAVLAPMAGFSDAALRFMSHEYGAGLSTTEMVSAKALEYDNKKTKLLLYCLKGDAPIAVQLFGHDPEVFAKACNNKNLQNFDIIDINMGCPTPKIAKNGDGSALISNLELAENIIKACKKATTKPVTVKFRIGQDDDHIVATEFAKMCERAGADAITVHGRTVKQGYSGKSNLDAIKKVVESVNIPVIASGDAVDKTSFDHILKYTGAAAVMIGRRAIGSPEIFSLVQGKKVEVNKVEQIKKHIEILQNYLPERQIVLLMRGVAPQYLKYIPNVQNIKIQLAKAESISQIYQILSQI